MSIFSKKPAEEPQNIEEVLAQFKAVQEECASLKKEVQDLKKENIKNINHVNVVRFNPFEGIGSNQSFSLAMLDSQNCGAVITSLFTREGNRVYAKPVKNGASEFQLSNEEKQAIEKSKNPNFQ